MNNIEIETVVLQKFNIFNKYFEIDDFCKFKIPTNNNEVSEFRINQILNLADEGKIRIISPYKYTSKYINENLLNSEIFKPLINYCDNYYNKM